MRKVYLVGAGPGDPELITLKGRRVLEAADVVLYDHLASTALLNLAPPTAEKIYVGKKKAEHAAPQDKICAMLVELGRTGRTVVRLKGGDPFVFGRGGEEAEALADAGIPFEVVPGVTSPLGIAAYTGVPLTHRAHTSVVTFVSGHEVEHIDWSRVGVSETLVIFMGLTNFGRIAPAIIARGRPEHTPAMAVRWGTRADQLTITGTLATLPRLIAECGMKPPATIIIGEVVGLRDKLNWYERMPLFGQRVVVTRAREQAGDLTARLRALAAEVVELPTIEVREAQDYGPLDTAISCLSSYDWLIFTSANGVRFFLERLDRSGADVRAIRGRICTIGPATRAVLEKLHLKVDLMPAEYVAEGLVEAFSAHDLAGKRVLLPRAAVARDLVPSELARLGARVEVVETYRTVMPEDAPARAGEIFGGEHKPNWITFTNSSRVKNFLEAAGRQALEGVRVASIGPVTSATARRLGIEVAVEGSQFTIDGLVEAIVAEAGAQRTNGR